MNRPTRSILEELNNLHTKRDNDAMIDTTANNIIESSINLLDRIYQTYDQESARDLERKFFNSIKTGDSKKFRRLLNRVVESRRQK